LLSKLHRSPSPWFEQAPAHKATKATTKTPKRIRLIVGDSRDAKVFFNSPVLQEAVRRVHARIEFYPDGALFAFASTASTKNLPY